MDTLNLIRIYSFVMSLLPPAQAKMGTFDATGLLQALQGEKINRNFFFLFTSATQLTTYDLYSRIRKTTLE